jgi:long-chain acyl-CoA synthetase
MRAGRSDANRERLPALEEVFRGRRIMLTGATGFLGKTFLYLLLRLHPEIERVYLLIRGDQRSGPKRLEREILTSPAFAPLREYLGDSFERRMQEKLTVVCGDITQAGVLDHSTTPFARGQIDAFVNCAGLVNFDAPLNKALAINTLGVGNVLDFCRKGHVPLMHISTCYVAGAADGHRYEDEIPLDWCPQPAGRRFSLKREIRDAQAIVTRIESASAQEAEAEGSVASDERQEDAQLSLKRLVEEELKREGRNRALYWGWPNTYSYSKSLGEQLVLAARNTVKVTVVRPAVIESAIRDPFPGWNQGVNTSAPLTYLSGEGYRFYPARRDLILDVIPVDLVAHAMFPILAALLLGRQEAIYQLGSSDRNPFRMERLIELTAVANRRYHREHGEATGKLLTQHLEPIAVSQKTYEAAGKLLPQALAQVARAGRVVLGRDSPAVRHLERWAAQTTDRIRLGQSLIEIYRPYIQEFSYIFHGRNIRELYGRLNPSDAATHRFDPDKIDWNDYWVNIHIPGLRRHIFPRLDLHTRGRVRARPLRFKHLIDLLEQSAERYGAKPALSLRQSSGHQATLTYRELRDAARRASLMLASRGVQAGDRVLLVGENSPDWVLGFFAVVGAGAAAVPLDPALSADELRAICRVAQPAAALCSAPFRRRFGPIADACGAPLAEMLFEDLRRPFILHNKAPSKTELSKETLASVVFTSGTTGSPKGAMLTHGNFTAEVLMLSRIFELDPSDTVLSLLPLHHCFEFTCGMLLPLASGAHIVYPRSVNAGTLGKTLTEVKPTALIGVPAIWQAIHRRIVEQIEQRGAAFKAAFEQLRALNHSLERELGMDLGNVVFRPLHEALGGRLRLAVSGGAALAGETAEFFNDIGLRLLEGYGLTEAAPVVSVARPDEPLRVGSVGKPLSGLEVRLASAEGSQNGEILVRGHNVMKGYFRNPAATLEALKDGWLHTGDLGRFDDEGRLYIVGRSKDIIVDAGGNNVYIDELEELYGRSPEIKELAIVPLRVGGGEQPAALVVPAYARSENRRAVEEKIRAHFEQVGRGLPAYKQVRILRFSGQELPRTRTRKIKRPEALAVLRAMVASEASAPAAAASDLEGWLAEALEQVSGGKQVISSSSRLFEDLGLDSLALAELAEIIAQRCGTAPTADQLGALLTAGDLQTLIARDSSRPRLPSYSDLIEPYTPLLPGVLRRAGQALLGGALEEAVERWLKPCILGRGNIPANRNVLVVANHASHLDFLLVRYALGKVGEHLVVLAAKDYFFNSVGRRFVAANFSPLIPFDRAGAQLDSLQAALAKLARGASVLMFPEGTRTPHGEIQEFKSGAGYLALRSGCDVLPVYLAGTYYALGKGQLLPRRYPVEVRIGPVIANETLANIARDGEAYGVYRKAAQAMRQAVLALAGRTASARRFASGSTAADESAFAQPQAPEMNGNEAAAENHTPDAKPDGDEGAVSEHGEAVRARASQRRSRPPIAARDP